MGLDGFELDFAWYEAADGLLYLDKNGNVHHLPGLLPWCLRGSPVVNYNLQRGLLADSYPVLYPYYPFSTADPHWIGAWDSMLHDGYWWG